MTPEPALASLAPLILIVVTLGYLVTCAVWPYTDCRWCTGSGKRGPSARLRRHCRRCDSTGLRLRIGRRIYNHLRNLQRARPRCPAHPPTEPTRPPPAPPRPDRRSPAMTTNHSTKNPYDHLTPDDLAAIERRLSSAGLRWSYGF